MPPSPPIPADLLTVLQAVRRVGRPRLVGGSVRDWLLGGVTKDFDIEVPGSDFDSLHRVLAPFGSTDVVGRSFGVIKLRLRGREVDFSLPRRESKTGGGHRGFHVTPEPDLSDADAAARRDFTVNAIGYDPFADTLIDPHHGERDLRARVLRHTSDAFAEDPLRVLRGMQLAARLDFTLAPETAALARSIAGTFHELPVERVWGEWAKWAAKSTKPSRGLEVLAQTGWLVHFPEIAALRGTPQEPEWHPEGDVFAHTAHCCDAMVTLPAWQAADEWTRQGLLFAILAHDFGKPATTAQAEKRGAIRWVSPGHEAAGGPLADSFLQRIGAPLAFAPWVRPLVVNHLVHHHAHGQTYSDTHIRRLARRLVPATIDHLCAVMRADSLGRPPLHSPATLALIDQLADRAHALSLENQPPRPILLGRHLLAHGMAAGPGFSPLLAEAFEAQLEGVFSDETGAVAWLVKRLPK